MRTKLAISLTAAVVMSWIAPPLHAQDGEAARVAAQVCASCHGRTGESISPAFPKIGGQSPEYLETQLKAFRDRTRADPMAQAYMWGMASQLGDALIKQLAAFYGGQKPPHGKAADPKVAAAGKAIYEGGIPAAKVQACIACHGKEAAGNGAFPRLAGQHSEYLVKQLVLFKSSQREGGNAVIMHAISTGMTFEQMQSVAAYLASK